MTVDREKRKDFLFSFSSSITNCTLYSQEHPITIKSMEKSFELLKDILEEKGSFRISVLEERLFIDEEPLIRRGIVISNIIEKFKIKGLNSISFFAGIEFNEFFEFVTELAKPLKKGGYEIYSRPHIKVGKLSFSEEDRTSEKKLIDLERKVPVFEDIIEELKLIFKGIESSQMTSAGNLKEIVFRLAKGLKESLSPLLLLVPFKSYEEYLYSHSINVCILTLAQAESLGFEGETFVNIGLAGLLHDIGKLKIKREIFLKEGILKKEEWDEIKKHPEEGAKLLMKVPSIPEIAVISAYEHHIKFDGSGYPKKRYNGSPSFISQMITISDFYDALRTERPYRVKLEHDEVLSLMDIKSGTDFNPKLLANFIMLF